MKNHLRACKHVCVLGVSGVLCMVMRYFSASIESSRNPSRANAAPKAKLHHRRDLLPSVVRVTAVGAVGIVVTANTHMAAISHQQTLCNVNAAYFINPVTCD